MRLTEKTIQAIRGSVKCKNELRYRLNCSDNTLYKWLRENTQNGSLTTYLALSVYKEVLGMEESEIFTEYPSELEMELNESDVNRQ